MSNRNAITLKINIEREQKISYSEGLEIINKTEEIKNLGMKYIKSGKEIVDLLDLSRDAFNRNILDNPLLETGVRHLHITGTNFTRSKIYIDTADVMDFIIDNCDITYWKKFQMTDDTFQLKGVRKGEISEADREYLAKALFEGRIKSSKQIESEFNRTRHIVSRMNNVLESITLSFPGSQRQFRRFVFSPSETWEKVDEYFKKYKKLVDKIEKID